MNHAEVLHLLNISDESLSTMSVEELKNHYRRLRSKGHPDSPRFDGNGAIANQQEVKRAFAFVMEERQKESEKPDQASLSLSKATSEWCASIMSMNYWMLWGWYSSMVNGVLNAK